MNEESYERQQLEIQQELFSLERTGDDLHAFRNESFHMLEELASRNYAGRLVLEKISDTWHEDPQMQDCLSQAFHDSDCLAQSNQELYEESEIHFKNQLKELEHQENDCLKRQKKLSRTYLEAKSPTPSLERGY